jgi:Holliday junction resolvasome RuvABC endonuclease subunit
VYKIGLDASARHVGICVLKDDTQIVLLDSYTGKEKDYLKLQIEMVSAIFSRITPYLQESILIIEDIFVGINPISTIDAGRLSGAIIHEYHRLTNTIPIIVTAIEARKAINLATNLSKVEYQIFVVDKFSLGTIKEEIRNEVIRIGNHWELEYQRITKAKRTASKIMKEKLTKDLKKITNDSKNALSRLSTQVKNDTGINEHKADAVILSLYKGTLLPA